MNSPNRRSLTVLLSLAATLLLPARHAVAQRWPDERDAVPFRIHADFSLASHDALLQEMGNLRQDVCRSLDIRSPRERIHVFLFLRKATYQRYMKQYFPEVPGRRALYIKARGPGMVFAYQSDELAVDVRHESTHALLHAALPLVPLWLDEGLAEYFEVPREDRARKNPHQSAVQWGARFGRVPSLGQLEEIVDLEQMGRGEYRAAWAWAHFMLHGPEEARNSLRQYMADLQANTPPGQLSDRLRRGVPDLERRFLEHFRSWK